MKLSDGVTEKELGLLVVGGLICTIGAIWWLKGFAVAVLIFGVLLLAAAWASID